MAGFDTVRYVSSLNRVAFGAGLFRAFQFYRKSAGDKSEMGADAVFDLCKIMARIWRQTALVLIVVSIAMSTSLKKYTGGYVWACAGGVTALAVLGSIAIQITSARATEAAAIEIPCQENKEKSPKGKVDMAEARSMGFVAVRNMAFCMGSFFLLAVVKFVTTLAESSTMVEGIKGMINVMEDVIITMLFRTLNRNFLRAVVNATGHGRKGTHDKMYYELYEAQKGFYSKVGNTFYVQSFLQLLPYLFAAAKPMVRVLFNAK